MRIFCWNVNGLRAIQKKGAWDWIINQDFDFVCLQEIKTTKEQLDHGVACPPSYFPYFNSPKEKKGYSGVAIYSKIKPDLVEYDLGDSELDNEGRMIALYFNDFVLITAYFPNGGGGPERLDYKMRFYAKFLEYTEKIRKTGKDVVFCGDVNTAHNEIDLARPKENENNTGFLRMERDWIDVLLSLDYVDVWRFFNKEKVSYTWWDMKTFARARNVGWRIDYFFITKNFLERVKKIEHLEKVLGSDHCPIVLTIK